MEFVISIATILIGIIAVGLAAQAWGVDSREGFQPDRLS
jgi:hypothetical protein